MHSLVCWCVFCVLTYSSSLDSVQVGSTGLLDGSTPLLDGSTALISAARLGQLRVVKKLLAARSNVNLTTNVSDIC